ncbi:AAA family ATPase [archaeon]|jgi:adenylate kinase|nr:AAA family ATPase [archaeon]
MFKWKIFRRNSNKQKVICVTGAVGTGKTYVSKKLAKALNYEYIDVTKLIKENKISSGYDKKNKCEIVDIKKLNKFLIEIISGLNSGVIVDSHMSHYLPKKYVHLCIVTKCDINILNERLKKRKYSKLKIKNNIEAEIFDVCLIESKKNKQNVLVLGTTKKVNITNLVEYIKNE